MVQTGFGGPEVVRLRHLPDPEPGPTEAVIRVHAAALNHLDLLQRKGPGRLPGFRLPHVAGMDVAGQVVAVGSDVTTVRPGDRVLVDPTVGCGACPACAGGQPGYCPRLAVVGGNRPGGFAEYVAVPAAVVHPVPAHVDLADAAALPTAWSLAWHAVHRVGAVRPGEWVLVQAGASAVSIAAIQLARRAGARVLAVARTEAKRAVAADLGADVLDLDERTVAEVRERTGGHGVDLVVDHVGTATWPVSLASLRTGGRLVLLGNTSGDQVTFSLADVYHRGLRLLGAGAYAPADFAAMLDAFYTGGLRVVRATEYPLADLPEAYARQESRDLVGKILVRP
ncbi:MULTISPECIES: alcohol dehydrogenase catalytic domain-containing protein [unclassified Micromonospora]|uniref:alcohol dehydrogenase catalytic domain-containing protein n=1 Tax=Micromonospora TaxID=1873 RepID=UPI0024160083|nr:MULTISPECIES: alcohol dehydrogenase catalytic domain-containing protein [unclassified Micromonospora]MDG4818860.1 alcohol dehydrogenase catalytic domain-containing protein [Micromonospora sp. WMMD956]WFE55357.1 alcohol dehydrogenase catalytic domain-containing protein [Micromonospora sp. WMMD712]